MNLECLPLEQCATLLSVPTIVQGEDKVLSVRLTDKFGVPLDPTLFSEMKAVFLNTDGSFLEKLFSLSQIVPVAPTYGVLKTYGVSNILLLAADTALLAVSPVGPPPGFSSMEFHYTLDGSTTIINLPNSLSIVVKQFPTAP